MAKELYVGSLSYEATEYDLEKLFSVSGRVTSVHLITDPKTGEFKGCGYVRMSTDAEAKDAIASLDGAMLIDRTITVSEARPQKQAPKQGGYKGKPGGAPRGGASSKGAAPKPAFAKSSPSKAGATGAAKAAPAKAAPAKAAPAKAAPAKASAAKPAAAKSGFTKPGGSKPGAPKPGKR